MKKFPHFRQLDSMDCGPSSLRMIAKYYGKSYTIASLREKCFITREGVSLLGISNAAENMGLRANGANVSLAALVNQVHLPCILHWNQNHFVVCYKIEKDRSFFKKDKENRYRFYIADPASTCYILTEKEFKKCWLSSKIESEDCGTVLMLQPTPAFYEQEDQNGEKRGFGYFFRYLRPYKKQLVQLIIGMLLGSIFQLIFPFLTQAMVDHGIGNHNLSFIKLILIAQLFFFITQLGIEFIRNWITLHMNARINISLISDFLAKLMRLPLKYFDTKMIGDILQRIGDHSRIESLLTGTTLYSFFSFLSFFVFAFILAYYNVLILCIFLIGNTFYVLWICLFLKYRRELDAKRFTLSANQQSNLYQIVTGMQEIKLNNSEMQQRWKWESLQVQLFKVSVRGLALGQYQQIGTVFFSQLTGILISYIAAKSVVTGDITLGMMMSISYIIGQLSAPVGQLIGFIQSMQDAKISLERLNEVHSKEDEEKFIENKIDHLSDTKDIAIENVSFSYEGAAYNYVLNDISLTIPANKTTAIIGTSGSGKTTLIKLLMGFYEPTLGDIRIGNDSIKVINPHVWREHIGGVMQDGFIFSDTIANNIAVGEDIIDKKRLLHAVKVANIKEFIDSLPLGYNTKIGMEGNGISQGQRQRILIARIVYKNPDFLFFDEATNALDANNEREIIENLSHFYEGKTVIIVAHRLSTVRHADNIIVLEKGKVIEEGRHDELVACKGAYYQLIKNQLELGA